MDNQQKAARGKQSGIDSSIKTDQIPNTHVSDRFRDPIDKAVNIDDENVTDASADLKDAQSSLKKSGDETPY